MTDCLYQLLLECENEFVNDIMTHLRQSTASHYVAEDYDRLQRRVQKLVAYFVMSMREHPDRFVDYVAEMARERIAEGYTLQEILLALRLLEEKAWRLTIESLVQPALVPALCRVTGTVGAAKDGLAGIYLGHLEQTAQAAQTWQRRCQELELALAEADSAVAHHTADAS